MVEKLPKEFQNLVLWTTFVKERIFGQAREHFHCTLGQLIMA